MIDSSLILFIVIVVLAIGFGVVNGLNDAANAIAASVGSRAISTRSAVVLAAVFNMAGAMTGLAVAKTIGKGILVPEAISYLNVMAALLSVIVWGAFASYIGMPVSITHGFVAGLAAAGIFTSGTEALILTKLVRVGISVVAAPVLGFIGGIFLMILILWVFRRGKPNRLRILFSRLQWLTTAFLAYSHGKNDGQMPIGVITMALVIYTGQVDLWDNIPLWVIIVSALSISLGTAFGGWRVIKTLGLRISTLQPVHGFVTDFSAASVIEFASAFGIPVSTTHCATASVMGVGATRRLYAVRWGIAGNIVAAWLFTFPICGGLGFFFAWLFKLLF
jgi:PiT family inorganic phosphate transporter